MKDVGMLVAGVIGFYTVYRVLTWIATLAWGNSGVIKNLTGLAV